MAASALVLALLAAEDKLEFSSTRLPLPDTLKVAVDPSYPPYAFLDSNGELRGLAPALWRLWGERNHVQVDFVQVQPRAAQAEITTLPAADVYDQLPTSRLTQSRYLLGDSYADIELVIYYKREYGTPPSLRRRSDLPIGVIDGGGCHTMLKQAAHREFVLFKTYQDLQAAVQAERVSAFCTFTTTARWLFSGALLGSYKHTVPLYGLEMHWGVPRGKEKLYHAIKAGFTRITPAEQASLYVHWTNDQIDEVQQRSVIAFYAGSLTLLLIGIALSNVALRKKLQGVIAQRIKAEQGAATDQARLRDALAAVNDVILELSQEGRCLSSNAVRSPLIAELDGHVGRNYHEFLIKPAAAFLESALDCIRKGLSSTRVFSIDNGQATQWYELRVSATASIEPARYVAVLEDITHRRRAELNNKIVARAYRLISICNLLLFKAKTQERLLFAICNLLCDSGPYTLVWVGEALNDEMKTIKPLAWSGPESEYLQTAQFSWSEDAPTGNAPAGRAIRHRHPARSSDSSATHMSAWRTDYIEHGFRVNMAFPLTIGGDTPGCLCLYADSLDAFNEAETSLLEALVENMMYGLQNIESRQLHEEVQNVAKTQNQYLNELQERLRAPISDIEGRLRFLASEESDATKLRKLTELVSSTQGLAEILEEAPARDLTAILEETAMRR